MARCDRRKDIIQLAEYFVQKHSARAGRRVKGVSAEASAFLLQYDWPGNVRELENAIERAVVLGSTEAILPDDLWSRPVGTMRKRREGSE